MSAELGRVRDAIAQYAREVAAGRPLYGEAMIAFDRVDLDKALKGCGVNLSPDDLIAAHNVLRQRAFMGGNYTLDARAVIAVIA